MYIFKNNTATYEGEWRGNFRDGVGKQVWDDGAFYQGEWSYNKAHGKGKFIEEYSEKVGSEEACDKIWKCLQYFQTP